MSFGLHNFAATPQHPDRGPQERQLTFRIRLGGGWEGGIQLDLVLMEIMVSCGLIGVRVVAALH
jgi:hypothetical protein